MPEADPTAPFYLTVADHDRGAFSVEGSMTDVHPWESAARYTRDHERAHYVRPGWPRSGTLAAEYRQAHKLAGFPPGSIVRPHL